MPNSSTLETLLPWPASCPTFGARFRRLFFQGSRLLRIAWHRPRWTSRRPCCCTPRRSTQTTQDQGNVIFVSTMLMMLSYAWSHARCLGASSWHSTLATLSCSKLGSGQMVYYICTWLGERNEANNNQAFDEKHLCVKSLRHKRLPPQPCYPPFS